MDVIVEGTQSISRSELYEVWMAERDPDKKNDAVLAHVCYKLNIGEDRNSDTFNKCAKKIKIFLTRLRAKWVQVRRCNIRFKNKFSSWLDGSITFELYAIASTSMTTSAPRQLYKRTKDFNDLSEQQKRKRVEHLLDEWTHAELAFAARLSLHAAGHRDAAAIVKEATQTSPTRANKIKKSYQSPVIQPEKYTPEQALSLYVDGRFSKHSYMVMQHGAKARNANIYPPYNVVLHAKKQCYPEDISVTDVSAEVGLQALLNHTTQRLVLVQEQVLCANAENLNEGLTLLSKWGCDGSSGHSNYKQRFDEEQDGKSDSSLFAVCLVPLRLQTKNGKDILWNNTRPSSTRFCRPIKLIFEKETTELTTKVVENIERQISELEATVIIVKDQEIKVDGKTFDVVSKTAVQTCGICKATPKIMNNLEKIAELVSDVSKYDFGLSTLHAYIRTFECMLHIAYKKNVKKWRVSDRDEKQNVEDTKKEIIKKIKETMFLTVDLPKPGYGTSNDGNTASLFFEQYSLASSVTGIDEELLKRLKNILQCISSGYAVNYEAFAEYAKNTARRYVDLYPWYPMPSSLHKLLIHGPEIIKSCSLPIGMMSEEALEARNKDFRRYREFNTRKTSRKNTMQDLLNSLLFSSDPLISSLSQENKQRAFKKNEALSEEVLQLLCEPHLSITENDNI